MKDGRVHLMIKSVAHAVKKRLQGGRPCGIVWGYLQEEIPCKLEYPKIHGQGRRVRRTREKTRS